MVMRIGIDASRAYGSRRTGTETYAHEMIRELLVLPEAKKHEWILYIKPGQTTGQKKTNVRETVINLKYLWTQAGLAGRTWVDRLDWLWVPAHTLPVLRKPAAWGGPKTIVTIHGIEYEWLPAFENHLQRVYLPWSTMYATASADKIVAVSNFTARQLAARFGTSEAKIEVIHEGVQAPIMKKSGEIQVQRESAILAKFGLMRQGYLIFVGTIQPRKNLVRLISAFAQAKLPEAKLVICGKWGWNFAEVAAAPRASGVEGKIVFTDFVDEETKQVLLSQARGYVQPSITEGFGLPVLEAMGEGVPVISSKGGALAEVIAGAGLLFDPENIAEMTEKLKLLWNSAELRVKLRREGGRRVKDFSWRTAASQLLRLLVSYNV